MTLKLVDIPARAWAMLADGAARGRAPFHTPVLATIGQAGPAARTVVLRAADAVNRTIICHTDQRSPKVGELEAHDKVAWVFYDREARVQLRLCGVATLHRADGLAAERWQHSRADSRLCYQNPYAPGTGIAAPEEALPAVTHDGYGNFTVLRCIVGTLDWLYLDAAGHQRARFEWQREGWQGGWVAP